MFDTYADTLTLGADTDTTALETFATKHLASLEKTEGPVLIEGPPGFGRITKLHDIARLNGCRVVEVNPALVVEPVDAAVAHLQTLLTRSAWPIALIMPVSSMDDGSEQVTNFAKACTAVLDNPRLAALFVCRTI